MIGKPEKSSFLWFRDLADVTVTPKTNIIYVWRHQNTFKHPRNLNTFLETHTFHEGVRAAPWVDMAEYAMSGPVSQANDLVLGPA